ncbi:apolipoprotein D-like [Drosophila novamexicana]|uniref:apolipoprotein D-like n=1 Tax=Drosophila novamexicana TaxID=47314 RepID=UPI0011E5894F|nr:apolipoprotein D-like [Drosophila novamexicana]
MFNPRIGVFGILMLLFGIRAMALEVFDGACPSNMTAVGDLDMQRYLGKWYTHSMYPSLFKKVTKCRSIQFDKLPNGKFSAKMTELHSIKETLVIKKADIDSVESKAGKIRLKTSAPAFVGGEEMYVLVTDYDKFAIQFLCIDAKSIFNLQYAAILTRQRSPSQTVVFLAQQLAQQAGIRIDKLKVVSQNGCPPDT